jgi:hypothetical protein
MDKQFFELELAEEQSSSGQLFFDFATTPSQSQSLVSLVPSFLHSYLLFQYLTVMFEYLLALASFLLFIVADGHIDELFLYGNGISLVGLAYR